MQAPATTSRKTPSGPPPRALGEAFLWRTGVWQGLALHPALIDELDDDLHLDLHGNDPGRTDRRVLLIGTDASSLESPS